MLTYPLMSAVQLVSGEIGRVTGCGLARNLGDILPRPTVLGLVGLLFLANTIDIGANLAAMGAAAQLSTDLPALPFTIGFAVVSVALQMFISYTTYARYLKWHACSAFLRGGAFRRRGRLARCGQRISNARVPLERWQLTIMVAIVGTISLYFLFWQSSQEVEEIDQDPLAKPLVEAPNLAKREIRRIRLHTFVGMAVCNVVALAINMSTAATLHAAGKTEIERRRRCGGVAPDCRRFCLLYLQSGNRRDRAVVSAGAGRIGGLRVR